MELDPQPRRDHEQGGGAGLRKLDFFRFSCSSTAVQRTLSLRLCPSTAVETAIAQCTSRWAMARGHRLNTSIVLAAVHGLSGLFRAVSAVEPSLSRPLPPPAPVPVPKKQPRFCGCIAHGQGHYYYYRLVKPSNQLSYWRPLNSCS